ncbi:MAG: permease-like cell division protein FtsX [Chitinophagales bacterium]
MVYFRRTIIKIVGEKKRSIRRFKPNYLYSIISTALLLFMMGILAMIFSSGRKLANQFKENLEFTVIIKDNVSEKEIFALQNNLQAEPWVKSAEYISKAEAAKIFSKDNGEDFKDLLDYNPLFASINLNLHSEYTGQDSINIIEQSVTSHPEVSEFYYEHKLVEALNDNLRKVGWLMVGISVLLIIVTISILDSTIRLSMYANRLLIRSMQLVGATRMFIIKPFLSRSMINGLIAAIVAIFLLLAVMKFATSQVPELEALQDYSIIGLIVAGILILGLTFSFFSTWLAVRKYLGMKIEELY